MYRQIKWLQAYRQAPWRRQAQLIGLFIVILVVVTLVGFFYLNIISRTAAIGREIQQLQFDSQDLQREIKDLETEWAYLTSRDAMATRAEELGFDTASPLRIIYLEVPGYGGREDTNLAPTQQELIVAQQALPPEYTRSFIEWMREIIYQVGIQTGAQIEGVRP